MVVGRERQDKQVGALYLRTCHLGSFFLAVTILATPIFLPAAIILPAAFFCLLPTSNPLPTSLFQHPSLLTLIRKRLHV
ncbi:hypothetical protein LX32DRAFT_640274 [Colletotrichum zoysiae]|uniref:Uncharacterized protein n=1 Tax=Colletotrichum zoysiae TaxID=1216348 RepID=A0AAD9M147_9PEZI|nr:hypothetical protein LX32DRAFT_640274 [Colletotrichum zoysiae]